jgi:hypothetical protein
VGGPPGLGANRRQRAVCSKERKPAGPKHGRYACALRSHRAPPRGVSEGPSAAARRVSGVVPPCPTRDCAKSCFFVPVACVGRPHRHLACARRSHRPTHPNGTVGPSGHSRRAASKTFAARGVPPTRSGGRCEPVVGHRPHACSYAVSEWKASPGRFPPLTVLGSSLRGDPTDVGRKMPPLSARRRRSAHGCRPSSSARSP